MPSDIADTTKAKYSKPQPYRGVIARFPRAILALAGVSAFGSKKHKVPMGDMSYITLDGADHLYLEAELRHMLQAAIEGPINHADGDLAHKAQKAWNALADLERSLYAAEHEPVVSRDPNDSYIVAPRSDCFRPDKVAVCNCKPGECTYAPQR